MKVVKRDGREVDYECEKIKSAISRAVESADNECDEHDVFKTVEEKIMSLSKKKIHVEEIQDIVEETLMEKGHKDVARKYILYREKRQRQRQLRERLGVVDDLKLGLNASTVLKQRYLLRDEKGNITETPSGLFRRVAHEIAKIDKYYDKNADVKTVEELFYNMMVNLDFLPNSPTLYNAGTKLGLLSACFVLPVEDDLQHIFEAVAKMAVIQKAGGGTGFSFSRIRPKGDIVGGTAGESSGPLSFMRVFNEATATISQGGRRRGANMAVLRCDHPDIMDFIMVKNDLNEFTNFNFSVGVTDEFMDAYAKGKSYNLVNPRTGDVVGSLSARMVMDQIALSAWRTGDPGIVFLDRINEGHPLKGELVEATNPCLVGETLIITSMGPMMMRDAVGKDLLVVDGTGRLTENGGVKSTGKNKKIIKIIFSNGLELRGTENHKIITLNGEKEMRDLVRGDICVLHTSGSEKFGTRGTFEDGVVAGYVAGDGYIKKNDGVAIIYLYDDDCADELCDILTKSIGKYKTGINYGKKRKISYHKSRGKKRGQLKLSLKQYNWRLSHSELPKEYFSHSREFIIGYLRGLFSADGSVWDSNGTIGVSLSNKNRTFLLDIQKLLLSIGIVSTLTHEHKTEKVFYDKVYDKEYICSKTYRLILSAKNAVLFCEDVGFIQKRKTKRYNELRLKYNNIDMNRDHSEISVELVIDDGYEDVYDVIQTGDFMYYANYIKVVDCGEQPLLPYESCNLGSINLSRMVKDGWVDYKKLKEVIKLAVHFLDNVIDANKYPFDEIAIRTKATRKIGLGVMGWAEMLALLGMRYDSKDAIELAEELSKFIYDEARKASAELAKVRGNFEAHDQFKIRRKWVRNATVFTIAPTGTISIIAGTSSGIEPFFGVSYVRVMAEGIELRESVNSFKTMMGDSLTPEIEMAIAKNKGSVKGVDGVPNNLQQIFKKNTEITPIWHVKMQAAWQKHVDNAVSKTCNLPTNATPEDIKDIYVQAYKDGCKGITVYRHGSRGGESVIIEEDIKEENGVMKCELKDPSCVRCDQ